jgi:ADP-heptose:LPS heptosyltransferase
VRIEREMRVDERELADFFQQMQREQFDIAIQIHGGGEHSNPFTRNLGAKLTVGLKAHNAPLLDRWIPYVYYQHEVLRFLEVVSLIGATTSDISPVVSVTEDDLREAAPIISTNNRPLVVLHPGASDPRRRWPTDRFAAVGEALAKQGARILITGTGDERALAEGIIAQMTAPAENLCDRLSLSGMTGLLSQAAVFISNDTGPLHLAGAVGASTVGIYWCGNLINAGPLTRAKHRPAVSWITHCPICGTDCTTPERIPSDCDHLTSFVAGVEVDEVLHSALDLLEGQKSCARR